jgi:hypothetical protein
VKVTLLLADSAQAVSGKLYVLGGGWDVIGPVAGPTAIAMIIEVPYNETNRPHVVRVELQDPDGQPAPVGERGKPIWIETQLEVGRPPGHPPGTPFNVPLAFNLGPITTLQPGARYLWVVSIDGETEESWRAGFNVRRPA